MDSTGAWVLYKLVDKLKEKNEVELFGFKDKHLRLFNAVKGTIPYKDLPISPKKNNLIAQIGKEAYDKFFIFTTFLDFIGEVFWTAIQICKKPKKLSIQHIFAVIYDIGNCIRSFFMCLSGGAVTELHSCFGTKEFTGEGL